MSVRDRDSQATQFGSMLSCFRVEALTDYVFFQEGPGLRKWQWTDEGIKVINGRNLLLDGQIDLSNTDRYISQIEFEEKYSHFAIEPGDLVVTSSGTIGKVARIRDEHLPLMMNTSVIRFHPLDSEVLDPDYLFTFLRSRAFQQQAHSFAIGAAQLNFGPIHLKQMKIVVPPIEQQRSIAQVVSAYDDLIENNRRRIQLLEQAARLLYQEWFVHLRFPGHEHVTITDGVPEGWERSTVGESSAFLSRGITPKYDEDAIGLVINQKCIRNRMVNLKLARSQSKRVPPKKVVQFGDVLINSTGAGTLGRVAQFLQKTDECTVDSHVTIARPENGLPIYYFGLHLTNLETYIATLGRGATNQTELSKQDVQALEIILPPVSLGQELESKVEPIFHQIHVLSEQNKKLTDARDLLLPRLMNGDLAA